MSRLQETQLIQPAAAAASGRELPQLGSGGSTIVVRGSDNQERNSQQQGGGGTGVGASGSDGQRITVAAGDQENRGQMVGRGHGGKSSTRPPVALRKERGKATTSLPDKAGTRTGG